MASSNVIHFCAIDDHYVVMFLKLKLHFVFVDEYVFKKGCYKEDVVQELGDVTESSSQESQSIALGMTEHRVDGLCKRAHFKGEDYTMMLRTGADLENFMTVTHRAWLISRRGQTKEFCDCLLWGW